MKKVLIYFAMAVVLALGSTSCSDFLEIEPVGAVNETNLTDQEGINYLLTGMYSALNIPAATTNSYFGASLTNYTYGDVMGGDANKGSTAADQSDFTLLETFSFTTDNSYIKRKWVAVYDAVARANNVMHLAGLIKDELSAIPGQEKDFYTEAIAFTPYHENRSAPAPLTLRRPGLAAAAAAPRKVPAFRPFWPLKAAA